MDRNEFTTTLATITTGLEEAVATGDLGAIANCGRNWVGFARPRRTPTLAKLFLTVNIVRGTKCHLMSAWQSWSTAIGRHA